MSQAIFHVYQAEIDFVHQSRCLEDGTIPDQAKEVLQAMGRWLSVNGEAIYGTRPWKISGEGPTKVIGGSFHDTATKPYTSQDIRFTTRNGLLYAIALAWPGNGKIRIQSLARRAKVMPSEVAGVQLLGSRDKLKWTRDDQGLEIQMPPAASPSDRGTHFFVTMKEGEEVG